MGNGYDQRFALLLIGDSGVGKSSLLVRFADAKFQEVDVSTIGVDFKVKLIDVDGSRIKLQIWDTAGQEKYRTVTSSYYRNARGILVAYDVTSRDSFNNVKIWLQEIKSYAPDEVVILLIGNKTDLVDKREVSTVEGREFAELQGVQFLETSARLDTNVTMAFTLLATEIRKNNVKDQPTVGVHQLSREEISNVTEIDRAPCC